MPNPTPEEQLAKLKARQARDQKNYNARLKAIGLRSYRRRIPQKWFSILDNLLNKLKESEKTS